MLAKIREGHKAWPLLIGPHYFGDYVIEYVSETHKYHNGLGICLIAEATIDIVFNPPDEVSEILQNVRTIISTRIGTVPLDRDFGLSWDAVDEPLPIAQARMRLAVIAAVKKYEPRAKVVSVELQDDIDKALEGIAVASVTVMIEEENE